MKGFCFDLGCVVNWAERWVFTFFDFDMVVKLGIVVGEFIGFGFTEDV